jgi:hypothetical protein
MLSRLKQPGSLELNDELNDLALKVLKIFSKLKEEKEFISEQNNTSLKSFVSWYSTRTVIQYLSLILFRNGKKI